ncbi:hypothetical protein BJX96DRAFT_156882 [Aspergillus floccosus]
MIGAAMSMSDNIRRRYVLIDDILLPFIPFIPFWCLVCRIWGLHQRRRRSLALGRPPCACRTEDSQSMDRRHSWASVCLCNGQH